MGVDHHIDKGLVLPAMLPLVGRGRAGKDQGIWVGGVMEGSGQDGLLLEGGEGRKKKRLILFNPFSIRPHQMRSDTIILH